MSHHVDLKLVHIKQLKIFISTQLKQQKPNKKINDKKKKKKKINDKIDLPVLLASPEMVSILEVHCHFYP